MLNPYHLSTAIRAHNEELEQSVREARLHAPDRPDAPARGRRLLSGLGTLLVTAGLRLQGQA